MKKTFTLLAAAAVVLSASAFTPNKEFNVGNATLKTELNVSKTQSKHRAPARKVTTGKTFNATIKSDREILAPAFPASNGTHMSKPMSQKANVVKARKAVNPADIEGEWTFTFGDYYFQSSVNGNITATYTATLRDDQVIFQSDEQGFLPFIGILDADKSTISFPAGILGTINTNMGEMKLGQVPFEYNYATQKLDELDALVATYTPGTLSFSADQGLEWLAYDINTNEEKGYFGIYDFVSASLKGDGTGGGGSATSGIEGAWTFTFFDAMWQDSTEEEFDVVYTCSYDAQYDGYWFEDETNEFLPFFVEYDAANNSIMIPFTIIGTTNLYYVSQEPVAVTNSGDFEEPDEYVVYYNPDTRTIDCEDYIWGLAWGGYYKDTEEFAGYMDGYYFTECVQTAGGSNPGTGDDDGEWTNIGNATFMDGWLLPGFGIDQFDEKNWYEVPLQRNADNENLYRLVGPYHAGPLADVNESTAVGYIQFDVTDPDHVMFDIVDAGFAYKQANISKFYCYNVLAFLAAYYEVTPAQVIETMGDEMPYTTFKDGVVSLTHIIDSDEPWYDACFGMQGQVDGGFMWTDESENPIDMTAKIFFPTGSRVDGIGVESMGEVRYFNLQGVEVKNPQAGSVVIRVEGDKAVKEIKK